MSRTPKQIIIAREWLREILSRGPASVNYLKQSRFTGWRTLQRVKAELGVKSIHSKHGWIWYLPSVNPSLESGDKTEVKDLIKSMIPPGEEPEEDEPLRTADFLKDIRYLHSRGESDAYILKHLTQNAKRCPATPRYQQDYLWKLILHVVEHAALPADPAEPAE